MQEFFKFFTKKEKYLIITVLLLGAFLRFYHIEARPFHHDESLNAIYGKYIFENPETGYYKYNPLVHGPLLYNLQPFVYEIFGASNWSARFPMAIIGFFFCLAPFFFRKYLKPKALIFLVAMISLSPSLIYWSRFVREDALVFLSGLIILYGVLNSKEKYRSYWILIGLSLHYTCKENFFVTLALLLGYVFYESLISYFTKDISGNLLGKIYLNIKKYKFHFIFALILSIFIFCYYYSAGFRYSEGILDGLYRKSFLYWFEQHEMERIKGPFSFQFLFLSWYEFPFIVFFFVHLIHFYLFKEKKLTLLVIPFSILALIMFIYFQKNNIELSGFGKIFKMKIPMDAPLLILILVHSITLTTYHLFKRQKGMAFWGYFFMANFFTYSYLGEKVPWLSQYILYPGLIYLTLYLESELKKFKQNKEKISLQFVFLALGLIGFGFLAIFYIQPPHYKVYPLLACSLVCLLLFFYFYFKQQTIYVPIITYLFVAALLFNLRNSIMTNFTYAGDAQEFIGQVHTTHEVHNIALKLKEKYSTPVLGYRPKILVTGLPVWPLNWYFHGLPEFKFFAEEDKVKNFDYVFDSEIEKVLDKLGSTHRVAILKLRGWWVPIYEKMTVANYINYLLWHNPWNDPGYQNIAYAVKK